MLNCCNVADLCVGYSFATTTIGVTTASQSVRVLSSGVRDQFGAECGSGSFSNSAFQYPEEHAITASCSYGAERHCWYYCGECCIVSPAISVPTTFPGCLATTPYSCGPTYSCSYDGGCPGRTPPLVQTSRALNLVSSGTVTSAPLQSAVCILLSSIDQLIPSNGWTGGIKLSALGS